VTCNENKRSANQASAYLGYTSTTVVNMVGFEEKEMNAEDREYGKLTDVIVSIPLLLFIFAVAAVFLFLKPIDKILIYLRDKK
jgi:hypothetical protein